MAIPVEGCAERERQVSASPRHDTGMPGAAPFRRQRFR